MTVYKTISEAIADLKKRGYSIDFNMGFSGAQPHESSYSLAPEKFQIAEVYRFEGDTNPDDEAIVYAIESPDGYRGILLMAMVYRPILTLIE